MKSQADLFEIAARMQSALKLAGIESIVIGGLAVAIWGEPRTTRDVDLKVLLTRGQADVLVSSLPAEYRRLSPEPEETLRRIGLLFVEDPSGIRIDLLLGETEFDARAISRRRNIETMPEEALDVCSPEDLIIYKIISTRSRDHDDVPGIIRRQRSELDDEYITSWLRQFEQAFDDSTLIDSYRRMRSACL